MIRIFNRSKLLEIRSWLDEQSKRGEGSLNDLNVRVIDRYDDARDGAGKAAAKTTLSRWFDKKDGTKATTNTLLADTLDALLKEEFPGYKIGEIFEQVGSNYFQKDRTRIPSENRAHLNLVTLDVEFIPEGRPNDFEPGPLSGYLTISPTIRWQQCEDFYVNDAGVEVEVMVMLRSIRLSLDSNSLILDPRSILGDERSYCYFTEGVKVGIQVKYMGDGDWHIRSMDSKPMTEGTLGHSKLCMVTGTLGADDRVAVYVERPSLTVREVGTDSPIPSDAADKLRERLLSRAFYEGEVPIQHRNGRSLLAQSRPIFTRNNDAN